jgi:hypothetical protein
VTSARKLSCLTVLCRTTDSFSCSHGCRWPTIRWNSVSPPPKYLDFPFIPPLHSIVPRQARGPKDRDSMISPCLFGHALTLQGIIQCVLFPFDSSYNFAWCASRAKIRSKMYTKMVHISQRCHLVFGVFRAPRKKVFFGVFWSFFLSPRFFFRKY